MSAQLIENVGAFDPWNGPVEALDPAQPALFEADAHWGLFERLRAESPVHYTKDHPWVGSFWSVTRYRDIMAVDTNHDLFSSEGSIVADDNDEDFPLPMFIAMDRPQHTGLSAAQLLAHRTAAERRHGDAARDQQGDRQ